MKGLERTWNGHTDVRPYIRTDGTGTIPIHVLLSGFITICDKI
jgi:hypothetical protein